MEFPAGYVVATSLSDALQKALTGAKKGDARFFAEAPEGPFHVVLIGDYQAGKPQSFEEARETLTPRIYEERLGKALEDTAAVLRKSADVKIFATGDKLKSLLQKEMGKGV